MAEYTEREAVIAVIEEKQKELCPLGRYSRTMVYGSDRDKFDSWQEIIDTLEAIPAADVVEVKHGQWVNIVHAIVDTTGYCDKCHSQSVWRTRDRVYEICPHCGAKMDGGVNDAVD